MWNSAKVFFPILKFSGDRFDVVCSISFPVVTRALELSMTFESIMRFDTSIILNFAT